MRSNRFVPRRLGGCAALIAAALACALPGRAAAQHTPREIIDHVDRMMRGNSSRGTIVMEIRTVHWTRSLEMKVWSLGTEYALVRVTSPEKEAGTATLKVKTDVWNYLPHVDRTIRIPPSLMMGSWMGSHFTNDDLVKESRLIEDYDVAIGFDGMRDGVRVWEFVLTPKPEAAVVWGKVVEQVRQDDLLPTWGKYYDDRQKLARTMTFTDVRTFGDRRLPSVLTVVPADNPGESTVVRYQDLQFDVGLTPDFFSLRNLHGR